MNAARPANEEAALKSQDGAALVINSVGSMVQPKRETHKKYAFDEGWTASLMPKLLSRDFSYVEVIRSWTRSRTAILLIRARSGDARTTERKK